VGTPVGVLGHERRAPRSAGLAGIAFSLLFVAAVLIAGVRPPDGLTPAQLVTWFDQEARAPVTLAALYLLPFAGIAFLWFIGVIREQLGAVEDRLFSTVFMGSGLLFLALLFTGAAISSSLVEMLDRPAASPEVWSYGRDTSRGLISVYAMRMAAVFTLSVSTAALRAAALPRWVSYVGYVVALALLVGSADQQWLQLAFPAWVLVLSTVILLTHPAQRAPHAVADDAGPG
jgi:hypothetical protein